MNNDTFLGLFGLLVVGAIFAALVFGAILLLEDLIETMQEQKRLSEEAASIMAFCYDHGYTEMKWAGDKPYCYSPMADEIVSVESLKE